MFYAVCFILQYDEFPHLVFWPRTIFVRSCARMEMLGIDLPRYVQGARKQTKDKEKGRWKREEQMQDGSRSGSRRSSECGCV